MFISQLGNKFINWLTYGQDVTNKLVQILTYRLVQDLYKFWLKNLLKHWLTELFKILQSSLWFDLKTCSRFDLQTDQKFNLKLVHDLTYRLVSVRRTHWRFLFPPLYHLLVWQWKPGQNLTTKISLLFILYKNSENYCKFLTFH